MDYVEKWKAANETISKQFVVSKKRFRDIVPTLDVLHDKTTPRNLRIEVKENPPDISAILFAGNLTEKDGTRFRWEIGPSHDADASEVWFLSEFNYEENSNKRIEARSAEDLRVCLITKVAEEVAYQHIRR